MKLPSRCVRREPGALAIEDRDAAGASDDLIRTDSVFPERRGTWRVRVVKAVIPTEKLGDIGKGIVGQICKGYATSYITNVLVNDPSTSA